MTALNRNEQGSYVIDGTRYPSVTTILNAGIPKKALKPWAARTVAENAVLRPDEWIPIAKTSQAAAIDYLKRAPDRDRDRGANLGSALHKAIECDTLGLPMPGSDRDETVDWSLVAEMVERVRPWVTCWDWELSEATIVNKTIGYAGTLDGVVRTRVPLGRWPAGSLLMLDLKTNKPGRQGHGLYSECSYQMAGYSHAEFICLPDGSQIPMLECAGAFAVWTRPDQCRLFEVEIGPPAWAAFLSAFEVAKVTWDDTTPWIGNEILMPLLAERLTDDEVSDIIAVVDAVEAAS